jgi:coenzyme F420-dependent glucose-6-phosphate dehydrogenase
LILKPEEKMDVEDPLHMERLTDSLPIERVASRWIVSNEATEVVERIRPYIKLGFNHLVFHAPGTDQARFLNLFARQLLPILRREGD